MIVVSQFDKGSKLWYNRNSGKPQIWRMRMVIQTNSQTIKQILELCEAFNMPPEVVALVKNKCWKLTRNEQENENGMDKNTNNLNN